MDILRPEIIKIGKRCYRKNPVLHTDVNAAEEEDFTERIISDYNDEICALDQSNVEETSDGFRTLVKAPSALFKFVIGRQGESKKRLETETRTKIKIPKQGQEGDIVIQGHERMGVISAKTRIEVLLDSGRQKTAFTHFVSVPFNTAEIMNAFTDFKNDVLRDCDGERGVDASIFQNASKLHLTIGCLVLLNEEEVQRATDMLQSTLEEVLRPILKDGPLHIQLKGLEYMNDDPSEVDVLYVKVLDNTDRLQSIADRLVDRFSTSGLMQRDYERVKLHVTVMNTLFRKDPTGTTEARQPREKGRKERESFSAVQLLKKFGDYKFGSHTVDTVHISQRHRTGPQGYYACAGSIRLT
ncbi:activating signal cointegrator 1 complex subunit 1-like isoform X6 [Dreissena polymorpha]|uniref:activating signal cointegrator 1 complex subunit 1-like isoform X6 n=1 Tax=Dreissena polymorpha TaxID=45954 RepID=UPI002263BBA8|nr:activating signal cointegrator 1 complex subunit 1-like isoform X6 [Dreissena polymorpha]